MARKESSSLREIKWLVTTPEDIGSVLYHELQHVGQNRHGIAIGINTITGSGMSIYKLEVVSAFTETQAFIEQARQIQDGLRVSGAMHSYVRLKLQQYGEALGTMVDVFNLDPPSGSRDGKVVELQQMAQHLSSEMKKLRDF